ncbi:MAG: pyridoxamine 5'-phosphate oxidase family protein [Thermomicrobiales bacterium]
MEPTQGDLALLEMPVARRLLESQIPARLAYTALDGTPRAIPMAFHWTGEAVVFGTWHDAPKVPAIRARPAIALTIDSEDQPYNVLMIRGTAIIDIVEGVPPEYAAAVERYMGTEQGRAWVEQIGRMYSRMARLTVRPEWVGLLDFETRFPSGIARRMHRPPA